MQFETFDRNAGGDAAEARLRVRGAVNAIKESGRSLYTLAALSGKESAVQWVHSFVNDRDYFDWSEVRNSA